MYNPPNSFNSNANFNKFKPTYFNGDIDVSGGHIINRTGNLYVAPNSNIYSLNNRIEFNDISNNIYFHTPLKMYYNSIEYDIGQKLGQIQDLYNKIGTMTYSNSSNNFDNIYSSGAINFLDISGNKTNIIPIINNNTQKLTNITFSGPNTTNFTGVLNFVSGQISVGAINGTAVNLNGEQTITATKKTFQNNLQLNGSLLVGTNGNVTITNSNLQAIPTTTTKCTNISYANVGGLQSTTITNSLISQTFSFTNSINNISTSTFAFLSGATSNLQSQINNISGVSLSANNNFTGSNTFNIITFTTSINNISTTKLNWGLQNLTSDVQNQINDVNLDLGETNTRVASVENKTQKQTYNSSTTTTSFSNNLEFTSTLNNISTTVFGYLLGASENLQSAINSLKTRMTSAEKALNPTGTIIQSVNGDTATNGYEPSYLLCDGRDISRTTYPALFNTIGIQYGWNNNATQFRLPDFRGMFLRGMGSSTRNNNVTYSSATYAYEFQEDKIQNHTHSGQNGAYLGTNNTVSSNNTGYQNLPGYIPNSYGFDQTGTMNSGRSSTSTYPANFGVYYYIKT